MSRRPAGIRAREKAREFCLQALYQWRIAGTGVEELIGQFREDNDFAKVDKKLFRDLLTGVIENHDDLKSMVLPFIDREWEKLTPIESMVLLLGAYEFARMPATPYKVIINQGVELAKSFGATESYKYINGVLDKVARRVREDEINS